ETGGDALSGMTDRTDSPRLAALRSLEESLLSHRRAQAAAAVALTVAKKPTGLSRMARLDLAIGSLLQRPAFLRGRRMRRVLVGLATLVALVAISVCALLYRLSSGPISLDFTTSCMDATLPHTLHAHYIVP